MVKSEPNKFGPISTYENGINPFPALQRRVSHPRPLCKISLVNLYTLPPSPPPCVMTGPVRTTPGDNRPVQPPRPPNAWILYRSDKLRELPPTGPGNPRRAQAEVSKLISNMWKNESEAVRTEYERRADAKKAEHHAMYPGYRFQPMKKEERGRLREEKRLEKERERAQSKRGRARPAPYAMAFAAPSMVYPAPYYSQEMHYGPAGPSPPLSAASSPNDAGPSTEFPQGQDDHHSSQTTDASPDPQPYPITPNMTASSSSIASASFPGQMPPLHITQMPMAAPQPMPAHLPVPGPSQWQTPQLYQPTPSVPVAGAYWPEYNHGYPHFDPSAPQSYVTFNMPSFVPQNMPGWMTGGEETDSSLSDSIQALMSATNDPSVFQLSNFNPDDLLSHPEGEIEVSVGQIPFSFQDHFSAETANLLAEFDFSTATAAGPSQTTATASQTVSPTTFEDLSLYFPNGGPDTSSSSSQREYCSPDNMFQYLNLDPVPVGEEASATVAVQSHSMVPMEQNVQKATTSTTVPTAPYVPPTGAAYSSTRRVAGSWKPTFRRADSPIDPSPTGPWVVPAS